MKALNSHEITGIPDKCQFLRVTEFAKLVSLTPKTVYKHIKLGKIKAHPDPFNPNRNVIPISELKRAYSTKSDAIVPYEGRQYPHMFYIFFLACSFGKDMKTIKNELENARLMVPPDDELKEITKAVFETAPDEVKTLYRRKKPHYLVPEFEEWVFRLRFENIYEDIVGYVPAIVMQNRRIRFIIELMSSANFIAVEIADTINMLTDLHIAPDVISHYCLMYYYVRQMQTDDWLLYLNDLGRKDEYGAALRNDCIDNKIAVIRNLKIRVEVDRVDEFNDAFRKAKFMYDDMAESNEHQKRMDSAIQMRSMSVADAAVRANLKSDLEAKDAHRQIHSDSTAGGRNSVEKEAEDNDKNLEDIIPQEEVNDASTGS